VVLGPRRAITNNENIVYRYADPIVSSPDGGSLAAAILDKGIQTLPLDGGASQTIPVGFSPLAWCSDGGILMCRREPFPRYGSRQNRNAAALDGSRFSGPHRARPHRPDPLCRRL
jgi:hypothetical protein